MNHEPRTPAVGVPPAPWGRMALSSSRTTSGSGGWCLLPVPVAAFFAVHVVMALVAQRSPAFSTLWALTTLLVGLVVLSRRRSVEKVAVVVVYVVGAELIWRGTHAAVFWEYGKYVLILLMGLSLLKSPPRWRLERRAIVFAACLVPSLAALPYFDRQEVAFNLSGPVALGVAVLFFAGMPIPRRLLVQVCVVCLGPIVGLAALSTFGTLSANPSIFHVGGMATTAGIGPNQVSSILGLGIFLAFVMLLIGPRKTGYPAMIGVLGIWLAAQTLLSFSRGGLWTAAGAILVAAVPLMRSQPSRSILLVGALVGFAVFKFVVFPATDQVSRGMVSQRFTDTNLTGRDKIMKADWMIFLENPVLGVGPGQSYQMHAMTFRASSAHTEYTRLIAEHGSLGAMAILMLFWMAWDRWREKAPPLPRALVLGFTAWAFLYLGHSAMRLSAPALCFGLGAALLLAGEYPPPKRASRLASGGAR